MSDSSKELKTIEPTPMQLAQAISTEGKVDPSEIPGILKELFDLQRQQQQVQAKREYDKALADAQKEMPTVVRDKKNMHTKSGYASLERVMQTCKSVWSRHGFAITFDEAAASEPDRVRVRMRVSKGEHTEEFCREAEMDSKGAKGNDVKTSLQGRQSTFSYLQRQLLCSVFNIAIADTDNDGNSTSEPIQGEQVDIISDLLDQAVHIAGADRAKFLAFYEVDSVASIPATRFLDAKRRLETKIRSAGQ